MTHPIQHDYLTTTATAAELGISRRRVQRYVTLGYLPAVKIGRDYFVLREALRTFKPPPVGWKKGRPRKKQESP